jgi:O-antigen/teichoic acid export membrane protein
MALPSRSSHVPAGDATAAPARARSLLSGFLADSVLMACGFAGTAVTGFAFWWIAAHTLPASAVGLGSAAVAAVGLVALVAEFGLGPLLIAELPRRPGEGAALVAASLAVAAGAALALGAIVLALALAWAPSDLRAAAADPVLAAAFLGCCALTTLSSVLDQALIGLLRAPLQMARGLVFGVSRLLPLALLAAAGLSAGAGSILGSWLLGLAAPLAIGLALAGRTGRSRPRPALLRPLLGRAGAHHLMTAALQAPGLALPVLAAAILGTAVAAPFYAALMVLSASVILPAALAMRLQVAEPDAGRAANRVRLALAVSCVCAALASALFATLSGPLLAVLGPGYPALAGDGLDRLGFAAFGLALKFHYLGIARLRGTLLPAGLLLGACALAEIGAASVGAAHGGLAGTVDGWLAALAVGAVALAPSVLREAAGRRARRPRPQSTSAP